MVKLYPLSFLVPLVTLFYSRSSNDRRSIERYNWDNEYDYIIGKHSFRACSNIS